MKCKISVFFFCDSDSVYWIEQIRKKYTSLWSVSKKIKKKKRTYKIVQLGLFPKSGLYTVDSSTELIELTETELATRVDGDTISLAESQVAQRSGHGTTDTQSDSEPIGTSIGVADTSSDGVAVAGATVSKSTGVGTELIESTYRC